MTNRPRMVKVLVLLIAAMTTGAIALLVLEERPLPAGAFSLASYSKLNSIEQITVSATDSPQSRWNRIEIFFSGTAAGNIKQIASLRGLAKADDVNFHFLVCNGRGSGNGQIQASEKWQRQWSCIPGRMWYGSGETIRICMISDGKKNNPTDCQMKRTVELVEVLSIKFEIAPKQIFYPDDWQM